MKKKLLSVLGCLLIVADGIILAFLLSLAPVGYSDADAATIGRKVYYGLPFPRCISQCETDMGAFGQFLVLFPFNATFWSVVVSFLSCIPSRKVNLKRIIAVLVLNAIIFGSLYGLMI